MTDNKKFKMSISLNVLNHLGLNLYSNTPAVLAEVIANAWDADATEVDIKFNIKEGEISIADNGIGMDATDMNNKYLLVGYERRKDTSKTAQGRMPMGRKGIGKLSLFSIANKIFVHSKKQDRAGEAFLMDAEKIRDILKNPNLATGGDYYPDEIAFDASFSHGTGTLVKIADLKKKITQATVNGLKKRIARRFGLFDDKYNFKITLDGKRITYADRDYFDKARFLFQYGERNYAGYCANLDLDSESGNKMYYPRPYKFPGVFADGSLDKETDYEISGWIAIARHSYDLDGGGVGGKDDNLNNITIAVRGKVAQEDILHEFRLGGMITKFMYGEIHADFLDADDAVDIATSGRQKIIENDPRYVALRMFIRAELMHIWNETNHLKAKKGVADALAFSPAIKEWYGRMSTSLKKHAEKIFGTIGKIVVDEEDRKELLINGILAFEKLKLTHTWDDLDKIDESNVQILLSFFSKVDAIEAARYREIVRSRLSVIEKLRKNIEDNALERVLQKYIFNHLWLLDPAWERATEDAEMEKTIQAVLDKSADGAKETMRIDIKYKKVVGTHVIVELKRASRRMKKTELEEQANRYINAVQDKLNSINLRSIPHLEVICIVGRLPIGWENLQAREKDENSLKEYNIKIITYDELINNAFQAYSKFIGISDEMGELRDVIKKIRNG